MEKTIYRMEKSEGVEVSSSAAATKGEQIMLSIGTVVCMLGVAGAIFLIYLGHVLAGILCAVFSVLFVVLLLVICILNHKRELFENAETLKYTIDEKENSITGKTEDHSHFEYSSKKTE